MIINSTTANFDNLSPTPVKQGKTHSHRSTNDADTTQSTTSASDLSASETNLTVAGPEIPNTDAADAITENMRQSILSQPTLAMLAQGNSVAQSALRLLQQ